MPVGIELEVVHHDDGQQRASVVLLRHLGDVPVEHEVQDHSIGGVAIASRSSDELQAVLEAGGREDVVGVVALVLELLQEPNDVVDDGTEHR